MKRVLAFIEAMAEEIALRSAALGEKVALDAAILDRSDSLTLAAPGLWSPNGSCRLIQTDDGWIAANLPREDDLQAVPALLTSMPTSDPWDALIAGARLRTSAELVARGELLGLALARVGETATPLTPCAVEMNGDRPTPRAPMQVVDFSSLWAGPLCGSVFAALGAEVVKIESTERPDPTAQSTPHLDQRLNGGKVRRAAALKSPDGRAQLLDAIAACDVLITSSRARALDALGLTRERLFEDNPGLVWIAITGHGWSSNRVAFGDDAAASGGLVGWEADEPRFSGDALADPLTGIAAANAALEALLQGRGAFIGAALARTAAYVAELGA